MSNNLDHINSSYKLNMPVIPAIPPILSTSLPSKEEISRNWNAKRELEMTDRGYACVLYKGLMEQIYEFEKMLNDDEEIAAHLASFGQTILIQIEEVSYHDPFLIVFYGFSDGNRVRLVQHTTQLNVLFTSIKLNPAENRVANRIGFCEGKYG
jgi:Family of unknown function (DUF6173)